MVEKFPSKKDLEE